MFRKAKNIDTAFRQMRMVALLSILSSLLLCVFIAYRSFEMAKTVQSKIYVLANDQALEAYASDRKDNFMVQAKSHIKSFHKYFFTLSPDEKQIQETISQALYLADHSAKKQYDNLKEASYFIGIISGNVSQSIKIDSVTIDLGATPYGFTCFARQEITRPTSVVVRSLTTQGTLREVKQSENNPHGFLIEKWKIIENRDISVKNR